MPPHVALFAFCKGLHNPITSTGLALRETDQRRDDLSRRQWSSEVESNDGDLFRWMIIAMVNSDDDLQALRLIRAYRRVKDEAERRAILRYVEEKAERSGPEEPPNPRLS